MKNLCFFLSQLFTDLFKKKKKSNNLNKNSIEMEDISTFNLEKHYNTYKPPEVKLIDLNDSNLSMSSSDDELFQSCVTTS